MADTGIRKRVPSSTVPEHDESPPSSAPQPSGKKDTDDERTSKAKKPRKQQPTPLRWDEICSMAMTVFTAAVTVYSTYYILQQMKTRPGPTGTPPPHVPPPSPQLHSTESPLANSGAPDSASSVTDHPAAASSPVPGSLTPSTLWTAEELAKYDGSDPKLPLLLGCIGQVFDVSKGKKHYGPGESYHHFCGRDASRAFVSGKFTGDGLTDDLTNLSYDNLIGVAGWRDFYHKDYKHVGFLVGRYYNESGQPTKNLTRFERQVMRAKEAKAKQEAEDKKFVGCNSYWSAKEGGKVYCEKGFPRQMFSVMTTGQGQSTQRTRCVCLSEEQIRSRADFKEYDNCETWSTKCQTAPPSDS